MSRPTMRFFPAIALLLLTSVFAFGQPESDTSAIIYAWELDGNYVQPVKTDIDTVIVNFQQFQPLYKYSFSNTSLGNLGSPGVSLLFFERPNSSELFYRNNLMPYFHTYSNTKYINTRKPFTHLLYTTAGSKNSTRQEYLNIFHSQNISEKFNAGFDYKLISAKGQYKFLDVKNHSFKLFSSYSGSKYKMHSSYNLNRYKANESGGVIDSVYRYGDRESPKLIDTKFSGTSERGNDVSYATNKFRYYDVLLSQQFKLFSLGSGKPVDTTETPKPRTIAEPILTHVFKMSRESRSYLHDAKDTIRPYYYDNAFFNELQTEDSSAYFNIANSIQLDFKTTIRNKVQMGIYGSINHEYNKFSYYSAPDTNLYGLGRDSLQVIADSSDWFSFYPKAHHPDSSYQLKEDYSLNSFYVSAGIYGRFLNKFEGRFSGLVYLSGYKAGQTKIDGLITTRIDVLKRDYELNVYGAIENIAPVYSMNNFRSNHYKWEQDLESVNKVHLSGAIGSRSNKFLLKADYALLRNYIFFNDSIPKNYGEALNVSSLALHKDFSVWKIHFSNKLIYQIVENESVLSMPEFVFENSTFFDHTWHFKLTGGSLRTILGFDFHYNSSYLAYGYSPALGSFYQQNNSNIRVGNYPYIDVFLNVRLKRTRFFAKFEHVNDPWFKKKNYIAVKYPAYERMFRWGLAWTFYN